MPILIVNDRLDALLQGKAGKFNFNVDDAAVMKFQELFGKIYIASGKDLGAILSSQMSLASDINMAFVHKDYDDLPGMPTGTIMSFTATKILEFLRKKGIPSVFTSGEYWSGCRDLMEQGVYGYCRNDMSDILLIGERAQELQAVSPGKNLLMVDERGENVILRDGQMMEGLVLRDELRGRIPAEGSTAAERNSKNRPE